MRKNKSFQNLIKQCNFILEELAGAGASSQNAIVEHVHGSLANIVRILLLGSGLIPKYWSFAIMYAACLKNRFHINLYQITRRQLNNIMEDIPI